MPEVDAMLAAMEDCQPAIVFLAYPNNPTDTSFMSRLGEFSNLPVLRTVSKMGLAGLRLGLLAGPAEWLGEIDKVRLPYNIGVLTQAGECSATSSIQ